MPNLEFKTLPFSDLTTTQLYDLLKLRSEVFVVEQNCVYQDVDGYDQEAYHVLAYEQGALVAYARLLKPGEKYPSASLGRVVNSATVRGTGIGRLLMNEALDHCKKLWPESRVTISAQLYLEKFYQSLGFQAESESYLEDDIPHIQMYLTHQ